MPRGDFRQCERDLGYPTDDYQIAPVRRPMINEIGHFALVLALCIAALQAVVPLVGAARNDAALMSWARPAALAQFLFIAIAFFALMHAYAVSDFSLANVAANSSSMKPLLYKLTGVWSNHEGSMLLWVFILALFGAAVAAFSRNLPPPLRARVLEIGRASCREGVEVAV